MAALALATPQLLEEISKLMAIQEMKVAIDMTVKGGLLVGAAATLSALVLGPIGFVFGGIVGGGAATALTHGKFKSVPDIILNDMTDDHREKLASSLRECLTAKNIYTLAEFIVATQTSGSLVPAVILIVKEFLEYELKMKVLH